LICFDFVDGELICKKLMISTVLELEIRIYLYYYLWRPVNKNKIWKEPMHPRSPLGISKLTVKNN